jgi:hypothetical protein
MDAKVLERHHFREVKNILDALQIHSDDAIFSKESPVEDRAEDIQEGRRIMTSRLEKMFAPNPITNTSIRVILDMVHVEMLGMAKELLPAYDHK